MKEPEATGKEVRKDRQARVRQNKAGIDGEKSRVHHLPDAGYVNARVVGKGMIAVDEENKRSQQRKASHVTDSHGKRPMGYLLFQAQRVRIYFQNRRTQIKTLAKLAGMTADIQTLGW